MHSRVFYEGYYRGQNCGEIEQRKTGDLLAYALSDVVWAIYRRQPCLVGRKAERDR